MALLALALLIVAVLLGRAFGADRAAYRRLRHLNAEHERLSFYRSWSSDLVVVYGGLSLITLIAAWSDIDTLLSAAQSWGPMPFLRGHRGGVGPWILVVAALLILLGLVASTVAVLARPRDAARLAGLQPILPRTAAEIRYGAATSIAAGVTEEVLFRLGLPAILFALTGTPWLAFLIAGVVFGLVHAYQGWGGAIVAGFTGFLFAVLYVATGSILLCVVVHALIDLRAMVLIPILIRTVTARLPEPLATD